MIATTPILPPHEFWAVRHGVAPHNLSGLMPRRGEDLPLSTMGNALEPQSGREGAQQLGRVLAALPNRPTRIISSGTLRTMETAIIAAGPGVEMDHDLDDRDPGEGAGHSAEEIHRREARGEIIAGAETREHQAARVVQAAQKYLDGKHVPLFVTHSATIRRLLEAAGCAPLMEGKKIEHTLLYHFMPPRTPGQPWRVTTATLMPDGTVSEMPLSKDTQFAIASLTPSSSAANPGR